MFFVLEQRCQTVDRWVIDSVLRFMDLPFQPMQSKTQYCAFQYPRCHKIGFSYSRERGARMGQSAMFFCNLRALSCCFLNPAFGCRGEGVPKCWPTEVLTSHPAHASPQEQGRTQIFPSLSCYPTSEFWNVFG